MGFLDSGMPADTNLLEPKYATHFNTWKRNPTPENTSLLLKTIQPEIDRGMFAHIGKSNDALLRSRAKGLAIQAIKSYDPSKARLGTHVINQLQGLKRISRQQLQILSIPERVTIDQGFVEKAKAELEDELGREASADEIADKTGLSIKRINYIKNFKYPTAEGSLGGMAEEGDESFMPAVDSAQSNSWLELVYSDVDDINKKIMEWTFGLHGSRRLSNQSIARKLRMTPGAVSQRKAKLQQMLNQDTLNPFL